jgi:flagellar protein FlbD
VIRLTRLNSQQITVNSDLIKLVESNPDTVLTLVSGDKVLVHETADEVVARVIEFKRAVLAGLLTIKADPGVAVRAAGSTQWDRGGNPHPEAHPEERSRG